MLEILQNPNVSMNSGDLVRSLRGNYKIIKKLGNGTFGDVYYADYISKNFPEVQKVALKEIARHNYNMKQCEKEGELMKKVSDSVTSGHVVKFIDSFIGEVASRNYLKSPSDGNFFITMKFCNVGDLAGKIRNQIKSKNPFEKKVIYDFMYQIADGIDELHYAHKIVHRDLKPANILITWEGGKEVIKIADFGLAKLLDHMTVGPNYPKLYGTPLYMAPEQSEGKPCRFPVDIWAVGIIFFELCISPKELYNEIEKLREKVRKNKKITLPERFPKQDNEWLNKMIAKNPDDRMSCRDLYCEARGKDF
ncbi:hypothetical protein FO519_006226 [Halicephalobus sp. NKZ332]|nr:hypothetical protein FO519_006226 [Halicephalobus sp. NKZ332]